MFSAVAFLLLVSLSVAQKHPLKNFCRIHGHQTTIVDRGLYIDGGLVNWSPHEADSLNYTNTWLRYGDLDVDNQGFPNQTLLSKNESVPSVQGGVLWPDTVNKIVYLYGGEYGNDEPEDFKLWYYDIVHHSWNLSDASTTDVRRAAWGAGVAVQDRGVGYYYGGWLTNASVPGYQSRTPLKNMLVYDMKDNSFKNETRPDDVPRAEGVMIYLPVGDGGFLVYFGGIQFPYGNETAAALPMTDIILYDIADNKWYKQTASGDEIPGNRRRFCAGAAWADDRSSYNIYLYGGASVGDGVGYGDVWILSLPSFTWIKFYPTKEDGYGDPYPHHSLTCDVIENSQMIIMGGTFPNHTECDIPIIQGQHGLDLGKANPSGQKWAAFNPNVTAYKVPTEIVQSIGGEATGGATVLAPTGDWADRNLKSQFQKHYTPPTRTPTRDIGTPTSAPPPPKPTSKGSSKKAIIGGAVGGGVGALLLVIAVAGICVCLRRRRRKAQANELPSHPTSGTRQQSMVNINDHSVSAQQAAYHSPTMTQYTHTLQGSPPPPSDHTWSQYGLATPDYAGSPTQFTKDGMVSTHHRNISDQSYNPTSQAYYGQPPSPPAVAAQELPNVRSPPAQEMPHVRSPLSFQTEQHPQSLNSTGIDPYYTQHPPRGAETEVSRGPEVDYR